MSGNNEGKRSPESGEEGKSSSVPLKKRARLTRTTTSSETSPVNSDMHAHFDCFSGAAGDMMLASCLDASDDPENLATRVVHAIKLGLPELADEFQLFHKKAWKGAGSIYAMSVSVESIYDHKPAPVPARSSKDVDTQQKDASDAGGVGSDDEVVQSHSHSHGHSHSMHGEDRTHDHSHTHASEHAHAHSHMHDSSDADSQALENGASVNGSNHHNHSSMGKKGPLRNLPDIRRMLENASEEYIPQWVKTTAIEAFVELAKAEASVHGASGIDAVHFHEVGAVDSIVDTVGTLLALYFLGANSFSVSPLPMGEGTVRTAHGILPVPAPATLHLMVGMRTAPGPPGLTGELVTPTAAAVLRALTHNTTGVAIDRPPRFTLRRIGIGAGTKDFQGHPNIMRLFLGDEILT